MYIYIKQICIKTSTFKQTKNSNNRKLNVTDIILRYSNRTVIEKLLI